AVVGHAVGPRGYQPLHVAAIDVGQRAVALLAVAHAVGQDIARRSFVVSQIVRRLRETESRDCYNQEGYEDRRSDHDRFFLPRPDRRAPRMCRKKVGVNRRKIPAPMRRARMGSRPGASCRPTLWLLLGMLLHAAPSSAQQDEPITRLPPLVVVAPSPSPLTVPRSWIPNWVDSLSGGEVKAVRPSILPDALERLPGATLQNEQGNPFQPDLTLRGFTSSPVTG